MPDVNLTPYTAEYDAMMRRRKLAEALSAQGMQELPANQTAGGYVIPVSPYAGLAKMLSAFTGAYGQRKADEEIKGLAKTKQQEETQANNRIFASATGSPNLAVDPNYKNEAPEWSGYKPPEQAALTQKDMLKNVAGALMNHPNPAYQGQGVQALVSALAKGPNEAMAKIDPAKFTAPSIAKFSQTQNYADLVPRDKMEFIQAGGQTVAANPFATAPGQAIQHTMSPDTIGRLQQQESQFNRVSAGEQAKLDWQKYTHSNPSAFQNSSLALQANDAQFNTGINPLQAAFNAAPQPSPQGIPQAAPPVPQNGAGIAAGGIPGNNFGNIRPVGGGPNSGFQTFATPQAGIEAIQKNLQAYGQRGINTLEKIITTWAPPSDNNPTAALIKNASQRLGIPPNQPLDLNNPAVLNALTTAIILQEHGPKAFAAAPAANPAANVPPGMTPKQASQLAAQREKDRPQATQSSQSLSISIDNAMNEINKLMNNKDGVSNITGGIYGRLPSVRDSSINAQASLDTLQSQIGVQVLGAMREASKTGGAVGSVTEKEWPILQNQLGALQQAQTTKQFTDGLRDVQLTLERVKEASDNAYRSQYGQPPGIPMPDARKDARKNDKDSLGGGSQRTRRFNPVTGTIE